MKERPILFSGPMVRAILEGRKTMTRRVMKPQPEHGKPWRDWVIDPEQVDLPIAYCPYGIPGDWLWVRETWAKDIPGCPNGVTYRADHLDPKGDGPANPITWRPSIFMPHWASRITLEITAVKVERVQDISEVDARAEGIEHNWLSPIEECPEEYRNEWRNYLAPDDGFPCYSAKESFMTLWQSINGKRPGCDWASNPWVWCLSFKRITE